MKEYQCDKCGKIFMHKHNYLHHSQRKKSCNQFFIEKSSEPSISEAPTYQIYNPLLIYSNCVYCNEVFSSNSARNRHMIQACKLKQRYKELIIMYDKELQNLEAENKFLKTTYENLFGEKYDLEIKEGVGLVNFQLIPHLNSPSFTKIREENLEAAAKDLTEPVFAIDDNSAVVVNGDKIEVVSEGKWKKFN